MGWVVVKFGGTSVSSAQTWGTIAARVRTLSKDHRVWVTASALSQVSNRLERCLEAAIADAPLDALDSIEADHRALAEDLGVDLEPVQALLGDLRRLLEGVRLTGEASARLRARVMSFGELSSTRIGVQALEKAGIEVAFVDAREILVSEEAQGPDAWLQATVPIRVDPSVAPDARVVLTQGFIARNPRGETVLLGRGGSDTSAALFAALLQAERLEIWTDVHGMFSANPREIPSARLIRSLGYREAQELAAMGAKVLHPRCLVPVAAHQIPLEIHNTWAPDAPGTRVATGTSDEPTVTAVVRRSGVTLLTLSTLEMWGMSGFLAQAFQPFSELGMSVDLVATSQSALSVTLDHVPGGVEGEAFRMLIHRLEKLGTVSVIHDCGVVSIVGRRIRAVLHELGGALAVFREHEVHLVSESSEDLNLSFVVDGEEAARLTARLHAVLFPPQEGSWEQLVPTPVRERWWQSQTQVLHELCPDGARYVYDLATVRRQARALTGLTAVEQAYYAMKANPHPDILALLTSEGLGLECVSVGELEKAAKHTDRLLFTPNFCAPQEYVRAYELGAEVTIDGPDILTLAPEIFRGRDVAVRIDPGKGAGHHEKVVTAGAQAKFGHPAAELDPVIQAVRAIGARITGLHAHVGSGILDPAAWARTGEVMAGLVRQLPHLRWVDLGGGLGVVERTGQQPLDLGALDASLLAVRSELEVPLRLEPGRFLVSEAGVLVARVTQVRQKGNVRFVGLATGMNSLIRPALYGAWHSIHNLSRSGPHTYAHVVGPICETGDVLGRDRLLPPTEPGDLVLIENAGAYGHAMSSHYNDRAPAQELTLS